MTVKTVNNAKLIVNLSNSIQKFTIHNSEQASYLWLWYWFSRKRHTGNTDTT